MTLLYADAVTSTQNVSSVQRLYRVIERARGKELEVPIGEEWRTLSFPEYAAYVGVVQGDGQKVAKWFDAQKCMRAAVNIDDVIADALAQCLPLERRPMLIGGDDPFYWKG